MNKFFPLNGEASRYIRNTVWMLSEKVFTLLLGLAAMVLLARSLGPNDFGILNYAISITTLISVICHLGLSGIVVKELKLAENKESIIATVFFLKLVAAFVGFSIIASIAFGSSASKVELLVLLLTGCVIFSNPFEVFNLFFQSMVKGKLGSMSYILGSSSGNILKIIFALSGLSVLYAASAHVAISIVTAIFLAMFYKRYGSVFGFSKISSTLARDLLKKGVWVFFGSISAVIYLKIDQIMLQYIMGQSEVGIYAAASKLSEASYFIPVTIMASIFPKLIEKKHSSVDIYHGFMQKIFDGLFLAALVITVIIILCSETIISLLYGSEYEQSSTILSVHILATCFIFMRALVSRWIIVEELYKFSLVTQGLGALANIVLNLYLIPDFGSIGAAWATVISYSIASYFSLLFIAKGRFLFWCMTKSIFGHWIISLKNYVTRGASNDY